MKRLRLWGLAASLLLTGLLLVAWDGLAAPGAPEVQEPLTARSVAVQAAPAEHSTGKAQTATGTVAQKVGAAPARTDRGGTRGMPPGTTVPSGSVAMQPPVESLELITEGAFPAWSPDGNLIAYCTPVEKTWQVFTMRPDGSEITCLTCDQPALEGFGHRGQPYWYPDMQYIVFTAENRAFMRRGLGRTALPGVGRNHDVWIMTSDGQQYWRLTQYPENWGAMRASFSHDGTMLYWNEEWSMEKYPGVGGYWDDRNWKWRPGEEYGLWRIMVADIAFGPNGPELSNTRIVDFPPPLDNIIEAEGFSPDDQRTIMSACDVEETDGQCLWGDIYTMNMDGSDLVRLTSTQHLHNENGTYSPDGSKVALIQSNGYPGEGEELYLMNVDGSDPVRLTYFSEPGHPEYDPLSRQITELSWSPDGTRIVFGHCTRAIPRGTPNIGSSLFILTLGE